MSVPAQMLNDLFTQKVATAEGKEKVAEYGGSYVRDRLREVAYTRKLIPPQQVTRADCQRSVNHDTLIKIVDMEPQSRAMSISFRGQPSARVISGRRFAVGFFTISSEMFQKTEQELLAYEMPITKIIEENSVKDIGEIEDREFTIHMESACQALQTEANGGTAAALAASTIGATVEYSIFKGELARSQTADTAVVWPVQRPDFVNIYKRLDGRRLRAETTLISDPDFDDMLQWTVEDFGDRVQSETTVDGYKYNTILGRAYVRTIKTDILRPGNIYCITKPEFFAKFYILNNTKFYIDKVANLISWQAWEDIAMGIANVAAVVKCELYSGNANPNAGSQTLISNFVPVEEDQLGTPNNRLDQGLRFPQINAY